MVCFCDGPCPKCDYLNPDPSCPECHGYGMVGWCDFDRVTLPRTDFGRRAEELCQSLGRSYTIKNDLRKEMEAI